MRHRSAEELAAGLDDVRSSPQDGGTLELIVARPAEGERLVLEAGELALDLGLVGDMWHRRATRSRPDGTPDPDKQVTLVNARLASLVAAEGTLEHRTLLGDQLHVDLDLSRGNLPAGSRLAIGGAVLEITDAPHTGCVKYSARFGPAALRFVNVGEGRELRLRGANARVVVPGAIAVGDAVKKR